jgi:Mycothiol maleylpyruvate isomerase N-terminal domain
MDAERLAAEEGAGWREFDDLLGSLGPERLQEPGVTHEGWSPTDVMFHVSSWLTEAGLRLEQIRSGAFDAAADPSGEEIERMNRSWFESSRQMGAAEVRAALGSSRARMLSAWDELEEKTPDAWSWFDESGPRHYAEHLKDLRAWIGRVGP